MDQQDESNGYTEPTQSFDCLGSSEGGLIGKETAICRVITPAKASRTAESRIMNISDGFVLYYQDTNLCGGECWVL